ncbi:hypothetical protein HED60_17400 [Planctomycetales bacterium ZRK34]|nr:hypothetical protein HED60_17400 [Planctomycetales bacterium ZRK34]
MSCVKYRQVNPMIGLLAIVISLGMSLPATAAPTAVVYTEHFNNPTPSTNLNSSSVGWSTYAGSTAVDKTNDGFGTGNQIGISWFTGDPAGPDDGYLFTNNSSTPAMTFGAIDNTFTPISQPQQISWIMGNSVTTTTVRLLVQVSGSWYASSTAYSTNPAISSGSSFTTNAGSLGHTLNFSTAAAGWQNFTLTPGSTMALGSVLGADLPTDEITGIGFYISASTTTTVRLDTLAVTAIVPEPASAMLVAGPLLALGMRRKR